MTSTRNVAAVATVCLTALMAVGLAGCDQSPSPTMAEVLEEVQALDAFEAQMRANGATPEVARLLRYAMQLEEGQELKFGPTGTFDDTENVLARKRLPSRDLEAVVVPLPNPVR